MKNNYIPKDLHRLGSKIADINALLSGNPERVVKRLINKKIAKFFIPKIPWVR